MIRVILTAIIFHACNGAKPLEIPNSKSTKFEYHFVVDWKMTMTWYNESTGVGTLLKYEVNRAKYLINTAKQGSSEGSSESAEGSPEKKSSQKKSSQKSSEENNAREKRASKSKSKESDEKPTSNRCQGEYKDLPQSSVFKLEEVVTGDGRPRRMIMVNGRVPAPTIIVPLNSEIVVKVSNRLMMEGITVHFHGIDKKNHWYMDGTSRLQQCPIGSGNDFTYKFKADVAGTHFYHGHLGMDRTEGLFGAIVVMPDDRSVNLHDKKLVPDLEYPVVLFDWNEISTMDMWYHDRWKTKKFIHGTTKNPCLRRSVTMDGTKIGGTYPLSAITINDKGWHDQEEIKRKPFQLDLETFDVEDGGKAYLFRVINAGQAHPMMISIEDHKLQVVSTDGAPVNAVPTDFLILYPGERYDFVLMSKTNADKSFYYFIVETLDYYGPDMKIVDPYYALAKIQYKKKIPSQKAEQKKDGHEPDLKQVQRCTNKSRCTVVNCPFPAFPSNLNKICVNTEQLQYAGTAQPELMKQSYAKTEPFEEYFINMNFEELVNGWRFQYPKGPPYFYPGNESLVTRACLDENWKGKRNSWCTYTLNITLGNMVQLTIFNIFGKEGKNDKEGYHHPVHLHGSHFYVVKVGYGSYNSTSSLLETANPDVKCVSEKGECDKPIWANSSWLHGSIPGMNLKNPVLKDTVLVPLGGYVVLRFKADNPGWWVFHCHIMEHHMAGMAFALKIGENNQIPAPPRNFPRCGVFDPDM